MLERVQKFNWGPILVAVGAALWGSEVLWRVMLNEHFLSDVLVLYEHLYCLVFALPVLWLFRNRLRGISRSTWLFLLGSGILGSAVGTYFFTLALKEVNLTVANLLLNIQPVFSAFYARVLLKETFQPGFFLWSGVVMLSGMVLSLKTLSLELLDLDFGLWMVMVTILCWSFGTVAGRAINLGMDYRVASPLRLLIGGVAAAFIVWLNGHMAVEILKPELFSQIAINRDFLLLSIFAGVIPLFLYFKGLQTTPASVAAIMEMSQILAALGITWGVFHQTLSPHQLIAAATLLIGAYQVVRIQGKSESPSAEHIIR